ncbi:MAG TPA: PA14 domain-containing protein [Terrimicrobiaceae bacterium]
MSIAGALESATLAWNASSGGNVSGYKVYYGTTSGSRGQSLEVGNVTSAIVPNLNPATRYFFSVTTYNAGGLESVPSNEVSHTTGTDLYVFSVWSMEMVTGIMLPEHKFWSAPMLRPKAPPLLAGTGEYVILANPLLSTTTATIAFRDVAVTASYTTVALAPVGPEELGIGLLGQYYNDGSGAMYPLTNPFKGTPVVTRTHAKIDFSWGWASAGSAVSAENFSVKWTGQLKAPVSGSYTFRGIADDGVRLFLKTSNYTTTNTPVAPPAACSGAILDNQPNPFPESTVPQLRISSSKF